MASLFYSRTIKDVVNNPQATYSDLEWLERVDAVAAASHPACPPDMFWRLAVHHPVAAFRGPAGALMTLEAPQRYQELVTIHLDAWLSMSYAHAPISLRERMTYEIGQLYLRDIKALFAQDGKSIPFSLYHAIQRVQEARRRLWEQQTLTEEDERLQSALLYQEISVVHARLRFMRSKPLDTLFSPYTQYGAWIAESDFLVTHQAEPRLDSTPWMVDVWQTILPLLPILPP